ncbi:VOC family protein [Virgisporangium ochraceum]|uniref:Glyoxalase-like domain-containing protein n=1 Tax=Virgisporangium ochraceum TaxID=65505 RepID=A0A8J3ZY60_9ACTN|nr:VOC family protein [Virgisporangium ochraceum]GIJ72257.1 hypothetical protein Voc01_071740 [Virgisporangium ochraceum]
MQLNVDLRPAGVTVFLSRRDPARRGPHLSPQPMDAPRPHRNRLHVDVAVPHDLAGDRVAAALAAGGRLVSDAHAPAWWVLADAEGYEACVATWVGRHPEG